VAGTTLEITGYKVNSKLHNYPNTLGKTIQETERRKLGDAKEVENVT